MHRRDWSDEDVRRTASALGRLPAAELAQADALLATVPGLARQSTGTAGAPPEPAHHSGLAGSTGPPEEPPPEARANARGLYQHYQHGRLSDEVP
jgi:hypothetical protein